MILKAFSDLADSVRSWIMLKSINVFVVFTIKLNWSWNSFKVEVDSVKLGSPHLPCSHRDYIGPRKCTLCFIWCFLEKEGLKLEFPQSWSPAKDHSLDFGKSKGISTFLRV